MTVSLETCYLLPAQRRVTLTYQVLVNRKKSRTNVFLIVSSNGYFILLSHNLLTLRPSNFPASRLVGRRYISNNN